MKKRITVLLGLTAVLALGGCTKEYTDPQQTQKNTESEEKADTAVSENALFGAFETVTLDSETVDQSIFSKSDLTMVNIWATYCQPCISEMPDLGELAKEYEEKGVQIIGIVADVRSVPNLEAGAIVDYTKADYTHLIPSPSLLSGYLAEVQAVPTTVFVDSEGVQAGEVYTGARSKEAWSEIIEALLAE